MYSSEGKEVPEKTKAKICPGHAWWKEFRE